MFPPAQKNKPPLPPFCPKRWPPTETTPLSWQTLDSNGVEQENIGIDFLNNLYQTNDTWIQTSYNTRGGQHTLGGTPFRKNFAGVGYTYDEDRDAFIPPKPYPSWILNEDTCQWESPTPYPNDGLIYNWNEETCLWEDS